MTEIKKNNKKQGNVFVQTWILIWGLGIAGQLCWNIENQWFNTFIYAKIGPRQDIIAWMVALSAIATTVSTFVFGIMSDRKGTRRYFVAFGYIAWGIFTIAFGLTEFLVKTHFVLAAILVVAADTIMSFFGSMGNDSGFNAWTNDLMRDSNRGQIGAALATQPVIGTIVGTLVGGMLIGNDQNYMRLFLVMGGMVIVVGIVAFFTMKDDSSLKPNIIGSFWNQFATVFNFKEFFKRKEMVLVNVVVTIFFIGFNVYFAHMGNFMIHHLGFVEADVGIIQGVALIVAMLLAVPATILINKKKTPLVSVVAVALNLIGLVMMYLLIKPQNVDPSNAFSGANLLLIVTVFFIGAGYVVIMQSTTVWAKQLYPADSKGAFEGIRILFFVLFPMVLGSAISSPLIAATGIAHTDPVTKVEGFIPTEVIFIVGAVITLLSVVPLFFASKIYSKRIKEENAEMQTVQ